MKELEELFNRSTNLRRQNPQLILTEARRIISISKSEGWAWVSDSLKDEQKKWFVAGLFRKMPVPKYFFRKMIYMSVMEGNPSANRFFIEPGVRSFGSLPVLTELLKYMETGSNREKAGAVSALYWVGFKPEEKKSKELLVKIQCWMLREFIQNEDVRVRQHIIPNLKLKREYYPKEFHTLIPRAIQIARMHPDDYIRHRVEIQLDRGGLFKPLPDLE